LWGRDRYRDLSTAIAGNGLQLEEHDTSSERIACDLELGRSIATQPIWFLAALEIKLILDGFLNIGRQQIVANHLSIAKETSSRRNSAVWNGKPTALWRAVGDTT
jgi:hypothetical protein